MGWDEEWSGIENERVRGGGEREEIRGERNEKGGNKREGGR